jgi:hypothetical protein
MSTPLDASVLVGYVEAEDLYIVFSEYYGDGTIYGRREMFMPSGELIHGAGKTWAELVGMGALVADEVAGAVNGDLVRVPAEVPVEAPAEAPVEVPAEAPVEVPPAEVPVEVPPAEVPAEAPAEVPAEVPVEVPAEGPMPQAPFKVRLEVCGMVVTYENVKNVTVESSDGTAHTFF